MYERLLILYKNGRLTNDALDIAVTKEWIKEEQKAAIIASVN